MNSIKNPRTSKFALLKDLAFLVKANYSILVVIGAVMALAMLSGCATPMGSSSDPYEYNVITGTPAVGTYPWH